MNHQDARLIEDAARNVGAQWSEKFNASSGVEQEIHREVSNAFREFADLIDRLGGDCDQDPHQKVFPKALMYHEDGVTYFWSAEGRRFVPQSAWINGQWFPQSREVHGRAQELTKEFHAQFMNADLEHVPS